ncbi:MAG: hypothetical protein MJE12_00745 [Alphaproteobacteria bacterium]|nr:hypothetical protein [Alphaproteobacteria bacterium]
MTFEREGIPTGTIVTTAFSKYGHLLTKMQSMAALPLIVIPHPIAARPVDEVRDVAGAASDEIVDALLDQA